MKNKTILSREKAMLPPPLAMRDNNCGGRVPYWFSTFCTVCLIFLTLVSSSFGAGGDILWQTVDSQPATQQATAMAVDHQGNTIVTGYQNLTGDGNDNFYTVKFNTNGTIAWRATFDKAGGSDQATAVAIDSKNDVIVAGYVWSGSNRDIHTIKYDGTTGAVLWQDTYNGAANGNDSASAIAVDSLNNIYVGGIIKNASNNDDYVVLKYAPLGGNPLWTVIYDGSAGGNDHMESITAGIDGVAVTGQSWNGATFDLLTIKYDFSANKLWEVRYTSAAGGLGKKVGMDAAGNVVITGYAANASNKDVYTVKYNGANGNVIWQKTYNGGYDDEGNGLYVDANGDVYITGYTWKLTGFEDFYTARYRGTDGTLVWQQSYDSGDGNIDVAMPIVVDEAGDVFVSGYSIAAGKYEFRTIKYKRDNGDLLWQQSFNGPDNLNDRPVGIGLSSTGELLVAGWSESIANNLDYSVIKYDAGALNPPANLTASALSSTSVQLNWTDTSNNEDGFKIERKLGDSGSYSPIATVGPNIITYTDSGLSTNNVYYYRVMAYNSVNGDSHYSNEANALAVFFPAISPAWTYSYNSPDNKDDIINAIAIGPDGNPVATGKSVRTIGGFDYLTVKLNRTDKSLLWSSLYDDPDSEMDIATCLAVDSNNNVAVSGYASLYFAAAHKNINSIYTVSYSPVGTEAWHTQYNGPGAIDDRANAIANTTDASGNVVVIGYGKNAANNNDIYVIKYNADGTKSWSAIPFDGPYHGNDIPNAVAIAPDGSVYVTGYSEKAPNTGVYNFFTAKYNSISGALVWSEIFSVAPGGDNKGNSIAVDAGGDAYVTGSAADASGNRAIHTIKYSGSSGTAQRVWVRSAEGAAHAISSDLSIGGISVKIDPIDGAIVVAGTVLSGTGDHDMAVVRYTPLGDVVWQKTIQRPANDDTAVALALDSSGYIYIAGNTSNGASSVDILSLIIDTSGTVLGVTVFNGAANDFDEATSVAVNNMGEAFIAGYSTNASGNADYVVIKQVNPYILVPAPFSAATQADYSKLNLSWANNTSGSGYRIERTLGPVTSGSSWNLINTTAANATSYQDSGLNGNSYYCYRIEAFNGSLVSRKIVTCATTTLPSPPLNPPTTVSATAIDLTWNNIAGNAGYKLERSTDNTTWVLAGGVNLSADITIYHDTGLIAGTVYYYRVSSINSAGISLSSAVQIVPVLNAPSGITSAQVYLTWPTVVANTGYRIERSTDNSTWTQIAAPVQNSTSYNDTAVSVATTYYYRIKAVTSAGTSIPSFVQSATTVLPTPTLSSATGVSTSQINLSWTDVAGENGFTVWELVCNYTGDLSYCQAAYPWAWGVWTQVGSTLQGVNNFSRISLTSGNAYQYYVVAKTSGGITSPPSNIGLAWTIPDAPTLNSPTATDTSVNLSWNNVAGDNGYTLERKTGVGGTYSTIKTLAQNVASYTDTPVSPQTSYYYQVKAGGLSGASAYSNEQNITTPATGPAITSVAATTNVTVNWNAIGGATGYEIERSVFSCTRPDLITNGGYQYWWSAWASVGTPATNSYTDSAVNPGCTYKYSVRANVSGTNTNWGSDGGLYAQTTPSATSITTITPSSTDPPQLVVNWSNSNGAKYSLEWKLNSSGTWGNAPIALYNATAYTHTPTPTAYGAKYDYRITATSYDLTRSTTTSAIVSQTAVLAPPTNLAATPSGANINLTWNTVTNNNGYKVEQSPNGTSSWAQIATPTTGAVSYLVNSGLTPGVTYYYRVSTKDAQSYYSAPSSVKNATTTGLVVPTLDTLSGVTTTSITLTWGDITGNSGYKIERSLDNTTWTILVGPTATGLTTYTNNGLTAGTTYYYRVSTHGSGTTYSVPSNVQSSITLPATTVITASAVSEARIDLNWQLAFGATNYRLQRSIGGSGSFSDLTTLPITYLNLDCGYYPINSTVGCSQIAAYTSYSDTGLTENTQYCYRLYANNATGDSAASTTVCTNTLAVGGPSLTAVTALNSKLVKLDWAYSPNSCSPNPCETPDGFEIWRQIGSNQWALWAKTASNATTYTDRTGIQQSITYNYKVRTYKGTDSSVFSNIKGVTTSVFSATDGSCLP